MKFWGNFRGLSMYLAYKILEVHIFFAHRFECEAIKTCISKEPLAAQFQSIAKRKTSTDI